MAALALSWESSQVHPFPPIRPSHHIGFSKAVAFAQIIFRPIHAVVVVAAVTLVSKSFDQSCFRRSCSWLPTEVELSRFGASVANS